MQSRTHAIRRQVLAAALLCAVTASASAAASQAPGARLSVMVPVSNSMGGLASDLNKASWDANSLLGIRAIDKLVYANIDEVDLESPEDGLMQALASAAQSRQPIVLESDHWNSARVEQIGTQLFGADAVPSANSAILMAEWTGKSWRVSREVSDVANRMGRKFGAGDPVVTPKALGGTLTAGAALWKFADAAYRTGTNASIVGYNLRKQATDGTYTIWESDVAAGTCVIGWRGSSNFGDWVNNLKNAGTAFTTLVNPTWDALNVAIIGQAYNDRFNNKKSEIEATLRNEACNYIDITGHSLGGAMALYNAYRWSYSSASEFFPKIEKVYVYNPARVGNSSYKTTFDNMVVPFNDVRVYCRTYDVVKNLPSGFAQQCTYTGAAAGTATEELKNHDRTNWTKCQSLNPLSC